MSSSDSKKPTPSRPDDLLVRVHELPNNIGCYGDHLKPGEKLLSPTYNALEAINSGDKKALDRLYGARRVVRASQSGLLRDQDAGQPDVRELGRHIRTRSGDRKMRSPLEQAAVKLAIETEVKILLSETDGPEDAMLYVDDLTREISETLNVPENYYHELKEAIRLAIAS